MQNSLMKISDIKANPNNPRIIKDDKLKKLVESVKNFPEMLEIRPIVVNKDMIILGGNMRFKACKEAWIKEIPVIVADNLTEEQEREFLIKDNVSGWEWDWDMLANEWDTEELVEWWLDIDTNLWQKIQSLPKVAKFIGEAKKPSPLSDKDVQMILDKVSNRSTPKPKISFDTNEVVRIIDGPFANFTGIVEEYDMVHGKLRLNVSIFGRSTPVEILYSQVEKII